MCILKKQKFLLYNILVEGFDTSSIFVSVVNKSIINLKITICFFKNHIENDSFINRVRDFKQSILIVW